MFVAFAAFFAAGFLLDRHADHSDAARGQRLRTQAVRAMVSQERFYAARGHYDARRVDTDDQHLIVVVRVAVADSYTVSVRDPDGPRREFFAAQRPPGRWRVVLYCNAAAAAGCLHGRWADSARQLATVADAR